jgi:hypothetical protein
MTRQPSNYHAVIYGLPQGMDDAIQGGSTKFETQGELHSWISENGLAAHPNGKLDYGILPDGRAVQIFHGHTESLVTKVEIG